jgi:hypothetical protein
MDSLFRKLDASRYLICAGCLNPFGIPGMSIKECVIDHTSKCVTAQDLLLYAGSTRYGPHCCLHQGRVRHSRHRVGNVILLIACYIKRSGHVPLPSQLEQISNLLLNFSPVTLQDSGCQVDAASVKGIVYNQKEGGGKEEANRC